MGYYSAIKNNEILLFAGKLMQLENITLNEVIPVQKNKGRMFSLMLIDPNINTSIVILSYIHIYMQNMFPKVGALEETKGRGKEE
jgi:hypothetical protein